MTGHSTSVLVPCSCFGFRPSPIPQKRGTAAACFSPHVYCSQTVAHLSNCWTLVSVGLSEWREGGGWSHFWILTYPIIPIPKSYVIGNVAIFGYHSSENYLRARNRIELNWITACTVVQAVLKANSQSNGNWQISTPNGSQTRERISMKLGIYNYVWGVTTHANPHGAATTWVVSANTWLVTCFGFLVLYTLFYCTLGITPSPHWWTDFDDLYVIWRVLAHGSAF